MKFSIGWAVPETEVSKARSTCHRKSRGASGMSPDCGNGDPQFASGRHDKPPMPVATRVCAQGDVRYRHARGEEVGLQTRTDGRRAIPRAALQPRRQDPRARTTALS